MATGDSLIPDGVIDNFKLSEKAITLHSVIRSTDSDTNPSNPTWIVVSTTLDQINNRVTMTNEPIGNIVLISVTTTNKPYIQSTPKPVISVESKVVATNSHSIYKGALIGNQVSDVIQVGNGANGLESKVLENSESIYDIELTSTNGTNTFSVLGLQAGSIVYIPNVNLSIRTDSNKPTRNGLYKIIQYSNYALNNFPYENIDFSIFLGEIGVISTNPKHSAIALDTSTSSAAKYFKTLEDGSNGLLGGVYGEQITYDGVSEWGDTDFSQLINGTLPDINGGSDVRTFHGVIPLNIKGN